MQNIRWPEKYANAFLKTALARQIIIWYPFCLGTTQHSLKRQLSPRCTAYFVHLKFTVFEILPKPTSVLVWSCLLAVGESSESVGRSFLYLWATPWCRKANSNSKTSENKDNHFHSRLEQKTRPAKNPWSAKGPNLGSAFPQRVFEDVWGMLSVKCS